MLFEQGIISVIRSYYTDMKKLTLLILLLAALKLSAFAVNPDSVEQKSPTQTVVDSLKQQLSQTQGDSLKAFVYTKLASQYLNYDTISNKKTKLYYQNEALNYTMLALHGYSKYNDTVGLRITFNALAKVYRAQRKFSQAKWFILQSNTLSRIKNDVPNIIASLTELAGIKMEIKDYSLAMGDLNEALKLSTTHHYPKAESAIQESYALLYSHLKEYDKEAIAMKRHNFIDDSISKAEQTQLLAKLNVQDSAQSKKKLTTVTYKRVYKVNSSKRIASI
jgi:tetratricopeptide (TPR) repeat protein